MAIQTDPTEYSDFTLEAQFKSAGGRFDCSGGLIFRYVDDKNFYLLSAGCPSDYFALSRMTDGQLFCLKQSVVPTDKDTWYRLKVTAQGGHFMCYRRRQDDFRFRRQQNRQRQNRSVGARRFAGAIRRRKDHRHGRRRERTGPGAGCIVVAVVSTKLPGARDGVACERLAPYSGRRWKRHEEKARVEVHIEPLSGLPLIREVAGGVGRTLGLTLLWGLEIVRDSYFRLLDRLMSVRATNAQARSRQANPKNRHYSRSLDSLSNCRRLRALAPDISPAPHPARAPAHRFARPA